MKPVVHIGGVAFYSFGLVFGCAACLGYLAFDRYFRMREIEVNVPQLFLVLVVAGLIGAKLDDALATGSSPFHHPFVPSFLEFFRVGYTYLGGFGAALVAGLIFARVNGIPVLRGFDVAFCMSLPYGVGRIGCFLAGDGDYGPPSSLPWAISFPHGIMPTHARVHPTMLYSALWELLLFVTLWRFAKCRVALRPGRMLGFYLIATGLGRFFIEYFSLNAIVRFSLTEAQIVSLGMVIFGVGLLGALRITSELTTSAAFATALPDPLYQRDVDVAQLYLSLDRRRRGCEEV